MLGGAAATGLRSPASFRLSAGRAEAGESGAAPAARGVDAAEPDGGSSGRLLGEPRIAEGRSAAASPSPTGRLVMSARSHRRPGKRRKARCSPRVSRSALRPRVRGARPGLPTLPLRKWCAALGEAEAALGAGVLPLGELLFTGEVGRAPELPLAGRRVAAEWPTARARVGTRLGGDRVPEPGPHAGSRY